jgi:hypothetical protein
LSKDAQKPQNSIQYLAPSPTQSARLEPFSQQISLTYFHLQQSQSFPHSTHTDTSIPSTQLPITLLPFAITDAIGSFKSHCYLMPSFWVRVGRSWWLWEWLDEEVLRDADSSGVPGL